MTAVPAENLRTENGRVKAWNVEEGIGWILVEPNTKVWVHYTAVVDRPMDRLVELEINQDVLVTFESASQDGFLWRAVSVQLPS